MNSDDGRLIDTDTGGILRVAWPRAESWWPRPESNQRHTDFQSAALPTELLGRTGAPGVGVRKRSADYKGNSPARQEYPGLQSCRFTDSKVNESKASTTKRWQRIARRCGWRKAGRAHDSPARRQQLRANSLGFVGNPNAVVTRFRHYEHADDETHRRHHNGVDQGIAHASGGQKCGGSDERHQT